MLKLVSLFAEMHKPKYTYAILRLQNWFFVLHVLFSWLGFFICKSNPNFYFQGIWALSGLACVVLLVSPTDF